MKKVLLIAAFLIVGLTASAILTNAAFQASEESKSADNSATNSLKEYSNPEFGYKFQYPSDWSIYVSQASPVGHVKISSSNLNFKGDKVTSGTFVEVYAMAKQDSATLDSWLSELDQKNTDIPILSEEAIDLNGLSAVKRVVGTLGDANVPSFDIYLESENRIYEIAGPQDIAVQNELEGIINSFQIQ
ncbi:MAG: hypothetical protein COT24_01730 [Candidatus Kerfeldbacteria bacterium CG08_land_8_20_14_0_20_40_16]|uniref:PsbP C-terminal domain-containing protein n=1 Tax=Candidatus Kerfeldbacteria bacterium CG08_land_8_20_14_0_20_40_16 TaxID=2014244 RepID=A0A2H0YWB2_9BACT|nr:MAG: hypothetical protein COT24_01730 [Candidatus Kerfeldbacteria bacterium CG08_land_8_20_14_0_20_40_16]